jgi:hypothetical protein
VRLADEGCEADSGDQAEEDARLEPGDPGEYDRDDDERQGRWFEGVRRHSGGREPAYRPDRDRPADHHVDAERREHREQGSRRAGVDPEARIDEARDDAGHEDPAAGQPPASIGLVAGILDAAASPPPGGEAV